jgi:hypothetical protein
MLARAKPLDRRHVPSPLQLVRERMPGGVDGRHDRQRAFEEVEDRRAEALRRQFHLS